VHDSFRAKINALLKDDRVSDIIIAPDEPVRFFVFDDLDVDEGFVVDSTDFKELCGMAKLNLELTDDDKGLVWGDRRLRCSLLRRMGKPQVCMRPIAPRLPTFDSCGFPKDTALREVILSQPSGIFFVSGLTGSGKSTTCAAIVNECAHNKRRHIITFEDPVEFEYERNLPSLISQRELGSDVKDQLVGIGSSMRQKPALILTGEVRDPATAMLVIMLAATGHRVFTTTHAESALDTIESFLKWLPPDRWKWGTYMLSRLFQVCIAQRLIRTTDNSRRYAIHEVLGRTPSVANIIKNAGDRPERLADLINEINLPSTGSFNRTWARSRELLLAEGIELEPES